jgi:DNA invertase Pin-like site-specific DNA recombinase
VPGPELIHCVLYAAKSTEDRRGSIPDQLRDCQAAAGSSDDRLIVDEYHDEACSAYHADRGPGLIDAMRHTEQLAAEHGTAELWAQHSDRLARGDGRTARHAVEIALWALKRDVRVRTIQDPDTFRDLLYAVVTGQRNHEDSRRKGLASAAGRRRAVERGEYIGIKADGYRLAVSIEDTKVVKRLEIDPDRQPAIELLFRQALQGKTSGAVARKLNDAGWLTKPREAPRQPEPWNSSGVLQVLHNPRYAGLAATKGQIVGEGHWPAYITPRQHHRLQAQIAARWRAHLKRPHTEPFLLSRLAKCGRCGQPLHCHTGVLREDGSSSRRYICRSHWRGRHANRCEAKPIDADILERMFTAMLPELLKQPTDPTVLLDAGAPFHGHWREAPERQQLREAALTGDDGELDQLIARMLARVAPDLVTRRRLAASRRETRQQTLERRIDAWAQSTDGLSTQQQRDETRDLNTGLQEWLTEIRVHNTVTQTVITAQSRPAPTEGRFPPPVEIRLDRRVWARTSQAGGRRPRRQASWSDQEIIAALQEWAARHGRPPNSCEWLTGSPDRPSSLCIRRRFGSWERALKRAGLKPNQRQQPRYWTNTEILDALKTWTERHGHPPKATDWTRAEPGRPCARSVTQRYGTFSGGLAAAKLI